MYGEVVRQVAAVLVFALAFGALLVSCGGDSGSKGGGGTPPPSPEEASSVVIRVSGPEGTRYSGDYGSIVAEPQLVEDALGNEPQDYEISGGQEAVSAYFQKIEPGGGELRAQILADGELVTESVTYAELGSVIVEWLQPGVVAPEELP